jgi:diadenosine tetraphosphate (Ap4A) HIT family hydrolase
MGSCYSCERSAILEELPDWERIVVDKHWRLAHSFNSALPGWLVAIPIRHVTALEDLTPEEAAPLGDLIYRSSRALRKVTGCQKVYVMFFAEAEGFGHVHFHLVPRMEKFTDEQKGPGVFTFLKLPEDQWVPEEERNRLAQSIRVAMEG